MTQESQSPAEAAFTDLVNGLVRERDELATMAARMGLFLGWPAGVVEGGKILALGLPTGTVSWSFHEAERRLLRQLPPFPHEYEPESAEERHRRGTLLPVLIDGRLRCGKCGGQMMSDDEDVVCLGCGGRVRMK